MKSCRGIINVICERKKGGCLRDLKENVQPGCMDCPEAKTQTLDLDGKVIFEYKAPEAKTGPRIKRKKTE